MVIASVMSSSVNRTVSLSFGLGPTGDEFLPKDRYKKGVSTVIANVVDWHEVGVSSRRAAPRADVQITR
jgi:hypothetical protein